MEDYEYHSILSIEFSGKSSTIEVGGVLKDGSLDKHTRAIVDKASDFFVRQRYSSNSTCSTLEPPKPDSPQADRIVLYFHGGLISNQRALGNARSILAGMQNDQVDFYPIMVNWDTDIFSAYRNDLFMVINGRSRPILAVLTSPFFILADVGRALTRLPTTYGAQVWDNARGLAVSLKIEQVPTNWEGSVKRKQFSGETDSNLVSLDNACALIPGVSRVLTTPALDAIGVRAFTDMRRRARMLFVREADLESKRHPPTGALSLLMARIRELESTRNLSLARRYLAAARRVLLRARDLRTTHQRIDHDNTHCTCESTIRALTQVSDNYVGKFNQLPPHQKPIHITVIGHSMGTIVGNELIRRNSDAYFERIVYMGAACTIREFASTVLTYLKANPSTNFYNLTLHPAMEQGERSGFYFLPFGSLLVWIDSFITRQESSLDWTLGRWNNIVRALPNMDDLTRDVRGRIHIKGFGNSKMEPTSHGAFNDIKFKFWRPEMWTPQD